MPETLLQLEIALATSTWQTWQIGLALNAGLLNKKLISFVLYIMHFSDVEATVLPLCQYPVPANPTILLHLTLSAEQLLEVSVLCPLAEPADSLSKCPRVLVTC